MNVKAGFEAISSIHKLGQHIAVSARELILQTIRVHFLGPRSGGLIEELQSATEDASWVVPRTVTLVYVGFSVNRILKMRGWFQIICYYKKKKDMQQYKNYTKSTKSGKQMAL
jgi:hypothetical protein